MNRALVTTLVIACACSDHDSTAIDPDAADPPAGFPATLEVPASSQSIALPFTFTSAGTANAPLGAIAMTQDVGSLDMLAGTAPAFVYSTVPFGAYTLYQGIAITAASWDVFWIYCMGTAVDYVYDEGVGGASLFGVPATGTCQNLVAPHTATVALPAFTVTTPTPITGYAVDGPAISIATTGVGTVTLGGRTLPLLVFGDVDCTTTCGTPGWYELHSVIWDAVEHTALFTIVYLSTNQHAQVELTYARSLPDLGDPVGDLRLPATWTAPPPARHPDHPDHMTMPPPHARAL